MDSVVSCPSYAVPVDRVMPMPKRTSNRAIEINEVAIRGSRHRNNNNKKKERISPVISIRLQTNGKVWWEAPIPPGSYQTLLPPYHIYPQPTPGSTPPQPPTLSLFSLSILTSSDSASCSFHSTHSSTLVAVPAYAKNAEIINTGQWTQITLAAFSHRVLSTNSQPCFIIGTHFRKAEILADRHKIYTEAHTDRGTQVELYFVFYPEFVQCIFCFCFGSTHQKRTEKKRLIIIS